VTGRLAEFEGVIGRIAQWSADIDSELTALDHNRIDLAHVTAALIEFDQMWEVMRPRERALIVGQLIESATCACKAGSN